MQSQPATLPGINIQAPWAEALVAGHKVIETRFYPMPKKWFGQPLAIKVLPTLGRGTAYGLTRSGPGCTTPKGLWSSYGI